MALFCAYTHSFSVLGKICEGENCSKIDIAPLRLRGGTVVDTHFEKIFSARVQAFQRGRMAEMYAKRRIPKQIEQ